MTNLNVVTLIGNLTRDADVQTVGNGSTRASLSVAVNRSVKKGDNWTDETSFIDVTLWGKPAESLKPYLVKGQKIGVVGYLKQDRWEKDGQKFSKIGVVADHVELCGNKGNANNGASNDFISEDMPF